MFKLAPDGTETVLHAFTGSDGAFPRAGLIADSAGNLYGTTAQSGPNGNGEGVVFKLAPGGAETVLYSFCPDLTNCSDGAVPEAGLYADSAGNLYGTTRLGGVGGFDFAGKGVVFKLTGTGFVTAIPFSAFSGKLQIDLDRKPKEDRFALQSSFTLSSTAPAINPVSEPVTLQIGTFSITIPPGSFKKHGDGDGGGVFSFHGVLDGVRLKALIKPTGTLRYAFDAEAKGANLTGTKNRVQVSLTIGGDSGTTSVTAEISH